MFTRKPDGIHTLYLCLYVDDLCYFSTSDDCEKVFEKKILSLTNVDFMGLVSHFLGIKFQWQQHVGSNLSIHLSQQASSEQLISNNKLDTANPTQTPYQCGHPVVSVPHSKLSTQERKKEAIHQTQIHCRQPSLVIPRNKTWPGHYSIHVSKIPIQSIIWSH